MKELKYTCLYVPPALLTKLGELSEEYGLTRQQTLELLLKGAMKNEE